jgi:hypothetical protein
MKKGGHGIPQQAVALRASVLSTVGYRIQARNSFWTPTPSHRPIPVDAGQPASVSGR